MAERERIIRQRQGKARRRVPFSLLVTMILFAVIVLSPLPFASVLPFERGLLEVAAFLALGLVLLAPRGMGEWRRAVAPAIWVAAIGLLGLLQSVPWPMPVARFLAPEAVAARVSASELLGEALPGAIPLSVAPMASRQAAYQWLAVAAALVAAASLSRRARRLLGFGLVLVAVFEVAYGASNLFSQQTAIWGVTAPGSISRLRGTFVNPNHLGFYLGMTLGVAFAGLWWALRRARYGGSLERILLYVGLPSLIFLVLFVGLAFSGSRGGLIGALAVVAAQTFLLSMRYRRWQIVAFAFTVLAAGFGAVIFFGRQQGLGRWLETTAYDVVLSARLQVAEAALALWGRQPVVGSGLGTFREAFPTVQPEGLRGSWVHAHNDILELLATTGLVGVLLACGALLSLLPRLWRSFRRGRRSEDQAMALIAFGALAGAFAHSFFDFGLTVPANGFLFVILCGAACGIALRSQRSSKKLPAEGKSRS